MGYALSDAAELLQGQPMFKILSAIKEKERQGENIIHFEIGDPNFPTPRNIIDAAERALENGYTHYSDPMGDYEFRKLISENNGKTRGFEPDINQVLVSPGANILIYYAVRCLVNPGDEVIVPDPCFPTYLSVFRFCGVKPVFVPLKEQYAFHMRPEDIRKKITARTQMIIVNSPHNPTGAIMTKDELKEIAEMALEHDIYLYSDEIYSRLNYGENSFYSPSMVDQCKEKIIVANGFSKAFAMTGWRLGVGIGPEKVMKKMGLLLETTSSCVPSFIQHAGIEAVSGDQSSVKYMASEYKKRREVMVQGLNNIENVSCVMPGGAFYVFANIKRTGLSSEEFAARLLNQSGVGLCPGTCFGESGEGFVRLCYATSLENIQEGIRRMKNFVEKGLR